VSLAKTLLTSRLQISFTKWKQCPWDFRVHSTEYAPFILVSSYCQ